jgi:hypothetical protein
MIGRIHGDIFFQDRLMLNDIDVKIVLRRSSDLFCLIGGQQRQSESISAKLVVRKVKLLADPYKLSTNYMKTHCWHWTYNRR